MGDHAVVVADISVVVEPFVVPEEDQRMAVSRALLRLGWDAEPLCLYHTAWGQPRLRWRPMTMRSAARPPLISICHERDRGLVAAAAAPGLIGVGVDAVSPGRLLATVLDGHRLAAFLRRLGVSGRAPVASWEDMSAEERAQSLARLFAVKEAVSKALGTGLRLGLGLGLAHGVPAPSIQIEWGSGDMQIWLHGPAGERLKNLGADTARAVVRATAEHVVALAVIVRSRPRNQVFLPAVIPT